MRSEGVARAKWVCDANDGGFEAWLSVGGMLACAPARALAAAGGVPAFKGNDTGGIIAYYTGAAG